MRNEECKGYRYNSSYIVVPIQQSSLYVNVMEDMLLDPVFDPAAPIYLGHAVSFKYLIGILNISHVDPGEAYKYVPL